jgi:hypothetical protein
MDLERTVGLTRSGQTADLDRGALSLVITLKLSAMGLPVPHRTRDQDVLDVGRDLFERYREQSRLLSEHLCPVDQRVQAFLERLLKGTDVAEPRLPRTTL